MDDVDLSDHVFECHPRFMVQTFHMDLRKVGFTPPYRLPDTREGRLLACLLLIYRNDIKMSFDGWFFG